MIIRGVLLKTFFHRSWNLLTLVCFRDKGPGTFSKLIIFFLITLIQRNLSLSIKLSQTLLIFLQSANVSSSSWLKMDSLKCGNLKKWSSMEHFLNLLLSPRLCFENGDEPWSSFLFALMSSSFECSDHTEKVNRAADFSGRSRNRPILEAKSDFIFLDLGHSSPHFISSRFTYILLISSKKSVKLENKELSICIYVSLEIELQYNPISWQKIFF